MDSEHTMEARKVSSRAASRLKQERERRSWTQSEVAERLGTTQINVSRWENGSMFPGSYYRQRLGELFGKSMEELGFLEEDRSVELGESPPTTLERPSISLASAPL